MTYSDFILKNKNTLLGYSLLAEATGNPEVLATPYPPAELPEDRLQALKESLEECIPVGNLMTDLWNWDVHFEQQLDEDWYFDTVFGSESAVQVCASTLADFFLEKCDELSLDYDQDTDYPAFESMINEQALGFVRQWRANIVARFADQEPALSCR